VSISPSPNEDVTHKFSRNFSKKNCHYTLRKI